MARLTAAVRRAAHPAGAALASTIVVREAEVEHHGVLSAVLATGDLDIDSLDAGRRGAAAAAFARMCHTLEAPLQLLVRVRRLTGAEPVTTASAAHAELDAAMRRHWQARLDSGAVHARSVLVSVRGRDSASLDALCGRLTAGLRGVGVGVRRLEGAELAAAVADGIGQNGQNAQAAQAVWEEGPDHVTVGEVHARGFALRRLPGHPVAAGWLAPLLGVPTECDIAIHLAPASLGDALGTLRRRLRDFSAHRMVTAERGGLDDVHVGIALDAAHALRERLARNLGRPLHLSVVATVRARTLDDLDARGDALRLGFAAALIGVEATHFRHLAALVSTMPLGDDALHATKLVDSSSAATCVPWIEAGCDDPGGYRLGATQRSGVPVRIAPFDADRHPNPNIAVLAASGHGKSFAIGVVVLEAAVAGVDSVIIDPEGEHGALAEAVGGSHLSLSPGTDASVNVFDGAGDDPEGAIVAVVDLVTVLCGDRLSDVERAVVDAAARDAIARAHAQKRVALLEDCLAHLEAEARPVAVVVRRFCTGGLGALFNRATSIRVGSGVSAISLRDLPAEHVPAATLIVSRWLWDLVRRDRRRRHIVFDEVGALCVHPPLRSLLVQLARRCRKYGASLVVATQNAQDLLATDEGGVILTNCAIALLGGHVAAETARMEHAFGLTEAQRRSLETASRGEFLLLAGERRLGIRIEVPAEYEAILTPP